MGSPVCFSMQLKTISKGFGLLLCAFLFSANYAKAQVTAVTVTDSLTQVFTDNQANYKETVYDFYKGTEKHDIFLVSTVNESPLYAYVDGVRTSAEEMTQLQKMLKYKRSIPYVVDKNKAPDSASIRTENAARLSITVDSLSKSIAATKKQLKSHRTVEVENKLKDLNSQSAIKNKELKDVSMDIYRHEVKNIPIDVKLHELLTNIITKNTYTPEQRKELNELIAQRNKNNKE
jgi:hypothetical protein